MFYFDFWALLGLACLLAVVVVISVYLGGLGLILSGSFVAAWVAGYVCQDKPEPQQ
jgi:hypothetical protein